MSKNQRTTFAKLQRERARQAKQAEKREKRRARRETAAELEGPDHVGRTAGSDADSPLDPQTLGSEAVGLTSEQPGALGLLDEGGET